MWRLYFGTPGDAGAAPCHPFQGLQCPLLEARVLRPNDESGLRSEPMHNERMERASRQPRRPFAFLLGESNSPRLGHS